MRRPSNSGSSLSLLMPLVSNRRMGFRETSEDIQLPPMRVLPHLSGLRSSKDWIAMKTAANDWEHGAAFLESAAAVFFGAFPAPRVPNITLGATWYLKCSNPGVALRRFIMRFLILSILGILALAGCSTTRTTENAAPRITNADLERMVKDKIASDPQLSARKIDVAADADKNQVTLAGTVPTEQLRTRSVELAKASRTGLVVVDKIDVKPQEVSRADYTEEMARTTRDKAREVGDKIGDTIEDAWIHTKITAKLIGDVATPARKINVDVINNVVTLRGKVASIEARTEAERIAKETEGVKRVKNLLKINAP